MHCERGVFSDLSTVTGSGLVMPSQEEEFSFSGQVSENVCSLPTENEKVKWLRKGTQEQGKDVLIQVSDIIILNIAYRFGLLISETKGPKENAQ